MNAQDLPEVGTQPEVSAPADIVLGQSQSDTPEQPHAELRQVAVQYQGSEVWVPEAVDVRIDPGEIVALIGPSGCGKSSVALTVNGLVPHSVPSVYRGSVAVAGREVADCSIADLAVDVAMVQQDPDTQILSTRIDKEVNFALENLCLPADQILTRTTEALDDVGLTAYAHQDPWTLSGGQRQRLALACGLAMKPQILVLDEPTANIDPGSADLIYQVITRHARNGMSVLVIEHDLDRIVSCVDRVVAIDQHGHQIASGSPAHVLFDQAEQLAQAGVWLPTSVLLAREFPAIASAQPLGFEQTLEVLKNAGVTGAELVAELDHPRIESHTDAASTSAPVPGLVARNLYASYGDVEVLHGINLSAPAGQITAVIGTNGAGKSTLLGALSGLNHRASAEEFTVSGSPLKPGSVDSRIGFVFQNPSHQFIHNTVFDELAHAYRVKGQNSETTKIAVEDLLDRFKLRPYQDTNPFRLSGGERRRLSVALSMGERRAVICFDEPTFGQDQRNATELAQLLKELADDGMAVIVSTHDMGLVADFADRVVVLHRGKIAVEGTPQQVFTSRKALDVGVWPPMRFRLAAALEGDNLTPVLPQAVPPVNNDATRTSWINKLALKSVLGPLTTFLAIIPAIVFILGFTRPVFCLGVMAVCSVAMLVFSGRPLRASLGIVLALWAATAVLCWSIGFSYQPHLHGTGHPVAFLGTTVDSVKLNLQITQGTRIGALLMSVMFSGATSDPSALLRAMTKHFHLPIRVAYAGVVSISFFGRFANEHRIILTARKLRGSAVKVPIIAGVLRWGGSIIPLLVSAVRHAELVSMAMDSRAFGAYRTRTELQQVRWKLADTVFLLALWAGTVLVAWWLWSTGLGGELQYGNYLHGRGM